MKVDGIIIAQIFGSISVLIYLSLTLDIIKYINVKYLDSKLSKSIIKYSIPLIPNVMCWWIMNLSDRYILSFISKQSFNRILYLKGKIRKKLRDFISD